MREPQLTGGLELAQEENATARGGLTNCKRRAGWLSHTDVSFRSANYSSLVGIGVGSRGECHSTWGTRQLQSQLAVQGK